MNVNNLSVVIELNFIYNLYLSDCVFSGSLHSNFFRPPKLHSYSVMQFLFGWIFLELSTLKCSDRVSVKQIEFYLHVIFFVYCSQICFVSFYIRTRISIATKLILHQFYLWYLIFIFLFTARLFYPSIIY